MTDHLCNLAGPALKKPKPVSDKIDGGPCEMIVSSTLYTQVNLSSKKVKHFPIYNSVIFKPQILSNPTAHTLRVHTTSPAPPLHPITPHSISTSPGF